ncbi:hypothetical protein LguiB_002178 [Lonicera macranthoides]
MVYQSPLFACGLWCHNIYKSFCFLRNTILSDSWEKCKKNPEVWGPLQLKPRYFNFGKTNPEV